MNQSVSLSTEVRLGDPSATIIEAAAKLPPRDLVLVEKAIVSTIERGTPELAESCVYCKPVGKKDGRQTFAIGPSVRLTEVGQQSFGSLWVNVVIDIDRTAKRIDACAKCLDLRTLNVYYATASKSIAYRDGGVFSDAVIENLSNGTASIARRNCLLQAMRPQLVEAESAAKRKVIAKWAGGGDGKTLDNTAYTKAFNAIAEDYRKRWGTTPEQLRDLVADESSPDDKLWYIVGIRNFLLDNDDKYADVFGETAKPDHSSAKAHAAPAPATAEPPTTPDAPAETPPETAEPVVDEAEKVARQKFSALKLQGYKLLTPSGMSKLLEPLYTQHGEDSTWPTSILNDAIAMVSEAVKAKVKNGGKK
jgi:hypothetical protein